MYFKENKPIYLQIAELICDDILNGTYQEEGRIPSVREYAGQVEVNANTVVRSFDHLQQEGIIYNRRGLGYFVSSGAREAVKKMRRQQFIQTDVPEFLRKMKALDLTFNDIEKLV